MTAEFKPYLCDGCVAKGDRGIDHDIDVYQSMFTSDVFRQARRYRLSDGPENQQDPEDIIRDCTGTLRYTDNRGNTYEEEIHMGDRRSAELGIACADRVLAGLCPKSFADVYQESEL